jgi:hypothetical protein
MKHYKNNKVTEITRYFSTITLNINGFNSLIKTQAGGWIKKTTPYHLLAIENIPH